MMLLQGKEDKIRCALYTLFNRMLNAYVYLKEYNNLNQSLAGNH